ncbi:hypothetical protein SAMN05421788_109246 [Filimonas lacunae]|uniref:Uncharacterized protein n=1 Tax=Filimonas lacunae TaxID=477680 RepID=A0A173MIW0_9BACT|nr:hypothetical protein [Filimonas lacunae]BAV07397.1 hypothetical protein FLA_3421 [Filimonas lacunae]SIT30518.1 hypothetical protein SAMN05421788_109246 [Filimonas lacunae]
MTKQIPVTTALLALLFYTNISLSQEAAMSSLSTNSAESFTQIQDSLIKREIGLFNLKGSATTNNQQALQETLLTIVLKRCSDSFAYFEQGSIIALDLLIHIHSKNTGTETYVGNIDVIYHDKYMAKIPDSAIAGIRNPKFCSQYTKRNKPILATCKAFRSKDRRRVYIYMLNGEGKNRYEVTWVMQDGKYLTRVIDPAAEVS